MLNKKRIKTKIKGEYLYIYDDHYTMYLVACPFEASYYNIDDEENEKEFQDWLVECQKHFHFLKLEVEEEIN